MQKKHLIGLVTVGMLFSGATLLTAEVLYTSSVSQWGITWHFGGDYAKKLSGLRLILMA